MGDHLVSRSRKYEMTKPSTAQTIVLIPTRGNNCCCWRIWYIAVDLGYLLTMR